jgi:hypothetical protein
MQALQLTTRFRRGQFEGDACLLVYDLPSLNGSTIGDDVRDVLERRPNTPQIFILAPFLDFEGVETAILEGTALWRAGAIGEDAPVQVLLIGLLGGDAERSVMTKSYCLVNGVPLISGWSRLPDSLREGWLFTLFDSSGGMVEAPVGVHFAKASKKHASKFLRSSNVLLSAAACGTLAFFALAVVHSMEPRRIFVDTAPLLSLAFAMHRIASRLGIWKSCPPARSFSSYGGLNSLPRMARSDLVLLSASTSGGLASRLIAQAVSEDMLLTVYFLQSTEALATGGHVLCDLTYRVERTFGYPIVHSFAAAECEMCHRGYVVAELEGDQFLLEKRAIKRLRITSKSQKEDARRTLEAITRTSSISVRLHRKDTRRTDIEIDVSNIISSEGYLQADFSRLLTRFTPMPLHFLVAVGLKAEVALEFCVQAGLDTTSVVAVESENLGSLVARSGANALVLIGHLCDHAQLRGINAQLRPKVGGGCVSYIAALTVADSLRNREDLRIFLSFGKLGPDTFTFRSALELLLPWTGEQPLPWIQELEHWESLDAANKLPEKFRERMEWLRATSSATSNLFLAGLNAELAIAPDFIFLGTGDDIGEISQADIYAVVCNVVATARANDEGLSEKTARGATKPHWAQTIYAQCVLCPSNFRDFNDAILRAAILRAASPQELNYSVDERCSEEMRDVIQADVLAWEDGKGDSLPEFLLSLACGRLRLMSVHLEQLKAQIQATGLPEHLLVLAKSID